MLKNKSKKTTLAKRVRRCTTILSKTIGLMFSKKIDCKALIFIFKKEKIIPLHNIFVFYPIDIIFLNKNKDVIEIKENFKPFRFYTPKNKAQYVIELPDKAIKKSRTGLNDKMEF